jgi:hypothetical protein
MSIAVLINLEAEWFLIQREYRMFAKDFAAYRIGNRWKRHFILMKWAFIGFGVAFLGFFVELVLKWGVGGDLLVLGIFAVIGLSIAGVINFINLLIGR